MTIPVMTFGKYKGKTLEWLFFNAPWYAHWLNEDDILDSRWDYDPEEREYFDELCRRASRLRGTCGDCGNRPMTRMELGDLFGAAGKGQVSFFCDKCYDETCEINFMTRPSFFTVERKVPRNGQLNIARAISDLYIGQGLNLTQTVMEGKRHAGPRMKRVAA